MKRWIDILEAVEITNDRVKPFKGNRRYLATGDLVGDEINDSIISVDYETKPSRADLLVNEGNIIVARMQATNKVLLIDKSAEDLIVSTGFLTLQPQKEFDGNFLAHYLRSEIFQREKNKYCSGATQKAINNGSFGKLKAPSYPLDEQKKIARILDRAGALRQKRKQSLQLLDDFLRATFLDMFGDLENRKKWEIVRLNEFIRHLTSGGRGWSKYYAEVGARFIRSFDVQMNSISNDEKMCIKPPKNQEADRTRIKPLDILLTITGSKIGRVATIPEGFEEAYVSQHVAIIRVDKINRLYLSYYLSMPECGQRIIQRQQYGQTKPGLSLDQIKKFPIPNPPIKLQNKFAQIVGHLEQTKQKMQTSLVEMDNQFNALTQRYFG